LVFLVLAPSLLLLLASGMLRMLPTRRRLWVYPFSEALWCLDCLSGVLGMDMKLCDKIGSEKGFGGQLVSYGKLCEALRQSECDLSAVGWSAD
jgi:hypothetical protein